MLVGERPLDAITGAGVGGRRNALEAENAVNLKLNTGGETLQREQLSFHFKNCYSRYIKYCNSAASTGSHPWLGWSNTMEVPVSIGPIENDS